MKTSVIDENSAPAISPTRRIPNAFEGRAIVFDGPEDYHHRIDDPAARHRRTQHAVHARDRADRLSRRRGSGEHAAAGGADQERRPWRCRASATDASPAPRARPRSSTLRPKRRRAAGSRCSRPATACASISSKGTANMLISDAELAERRAALEAQPLRVSRRARRRGRKSSASMVDQFDEGMVLKPAIEFQRLAQTAGAPRDSH